MKRKYRLLEIKRKNEKQLLYKSGIITILAGVGFAAPTLTARADEASPSVVTVTTVAAPQGSSTVATSLSDSSAPTSSTSTAPLSDTSAVSQSSSQLPTAISDLPSSTVPSSAASSASSDSAVLLSSAASTSVSSSLTSNALSSSQSSTTSPIASLATSAVPADGAVLSNTTTHQFYAIAQTVSVVNSLFVSQNPQYTNGVTLKTGDIVYENMDHTGQTYQIIASIDNSDPNTSGPLNGLAAMAVSPIYNGVPDLNTIIITYPGLNQNSTYDVLTGLETVVGGSTELFNGSTTVPGQIISAKQFADDVIATYPSAHIAFTGISLGGYRALAVGAAEHLPVVAFIAPDPANIMSPADISWVQSHPNMYFNNRNTWDLIFGAYGGNTLNIATYYDGGYSGLFQSHYPNDYVFNSEGVISSPGDPILGPLVNDVVTVLDRPVISPLVSAGVNVAKYTVTNVIPAVAPVITPIINTVVPIASNVLNTVNNAVTVAGNTVESTVSNVTNTVLSWLPKW